MRAASRAESSTSRTLTGFPIVSSGAGDFAPFLRLARGRTFTEGKGKSGALSGASVGPDRSAVTLDDPSDRGQADPRPFEFSGRMKPLEGGKHFCSLRRIEPCTVVAYEVDAPSVFHPGPYGDRR